MRVRLSGFVVLSACVLRAASAAPGAASLQRGTPDSAPTDVSLLLAKAAAYVATYERAFSAVVVEEQYVQTQGSVHTSMKSDLLLVWPSNSDRCVSFRDVLQVNGAWVRDRDDRLQKVFLAQSSASMAAQLDAIKQESSRYNVGPIARNVNVPLFALRVLSPENRARFSFAVAKEGKVAGVVVKRLDFVETQRPTLVTDAAGTEEIPLRGWFSVEPLTGAIVETTVEAVTPMLVSRFVVHYRHDAKLHLWVPADMIESYWAPNGNRVLSGTATYRNLRQFQVTTEEKVTLPK